MPARGGRLLILTSNNQSSDIEIDETQELNYPFIVKAILETGYKGFLGQEFIPVRDPLTSLAQGFRICDV